MFMRMLVVSFAVVAMAAAPPVPPRLDRQGDPLPMHAMARLGTTRLRPTHWVGRLAFSPDGKSLASSGRGGVRVWRVADGRLVPHLSRAGAFDVVRGDRLYALVESQGGKILWQDALASGVPLRKQSSSRRNEVMPLYSPDRTMHATINFIGGITDSVRFAHSQTNKPAGSIKGKTAKGREFGSRSATFTQDGKRLWTGDTTASEGHLRLWDVATKAMLRELPAGRGAACAIAISDDGKMLAVAHATTNIFDDHDQKETAVTLRDAVTGKELHVLTKHGPRTFALAFSPDGKKVAVGRAGAIELYDTATGKVLDAAPGHTAGVLQVAFRPEGREIVTASNDWTVRVWDVTGKHSSYTDQTHYTPEVLAVSPSGTHAAWSDPENKAFVRDLRSGKVTKIETQKGNKFLLRQADLGTVFSVWTPGFRRKDAPLWELPYSKVVADGVVREGENPLWVAISPDGRYFAMCDYDRPFVLYEAAQASRRLTFERPGKPTGILLFSRDGRTLAASHADQTISLWEVATGKHRGIRISHPSHTPNLHAYDPIALSPNGCLLATGGIGPETTVRLWDTATGEELCRLAGHTDDINALAFSPDGRRLASASRDTTALIWDIDEALAARKPRPTPTAARLRSCWDDLLSDDVELAHRAVGTLVAAPREAVALLEGKLTPVRSMVAEADLKRWVTGLDDEEQTVRDESERRLKAAGEAALLALREAARSKSTEVRHRAARLLAPLEAAVPTGETLRAIRAVEALERIGSEGANQLLRKLAKGDRSVRLTREAEAALRR